MVYEKLFPLLDGMMIEMGNAISDHEREIEKHKMSIEMIKARLSVINELRDFHVLKVLVPYSAESSSMGSGGPVRNKRGGRS